MESVITNEKGKSEKGKEKAKRLEKSAKGAAKTESATKVVVRNRKSKQFRIGHSSSGKKLVGEIVRADSGVWEFLISPKKAGLEKAARHVWEASPIQRVELERRGMPATFVKRMAKGMDIPANRLYTILGVSRATANRQVEAEGLISGAGGYAAVAMLQLIGEVEVMLTDSTSDEVQNFDSAKWLGQWIERPQPALGGKCPAELLDTPTGVEIVSRTLGAISSGAYQ